jgi:hypothetical protein
MRILSILIGAIFVAWIAHGLHTNPRWTWSPGEGELPRDVVALYMEKAYEEGKVEEAKELFYSPKTKDAVASERLFPSGETFTPEVIRVIAEGFNVAVHFRANDADAIPTEFIEIYHVRGGRILSRERIVHRTGEPTTALSTQVDELVSLNINN